jgi:hypothetical protein
MTFGRGDLKALVYQRIPLHDEAEGAIGLGAGSGAEAVRHFALEHDHRQAQARSQLQQTHENRDRRVIGQVRHDAEGPGQAFEIELQRIGLDDLHVGSIGETLAQGIDEVAIQLQGDHPAGPGRQGLREHPRPRADLQNRVLVADLGEAKDAAQHRRAHQKMLPEPLLGARRRRLHVFGVVHGGVPLP